MIALEGKDDELCLKNSTIRLTSILGPLREKWIEKVTICWVQACRSGNVSNEFGKLDFETQCWCRNFLPSLSSSKNYHSSDKGNQLICWSTLEGLIILLT